MCTEVAHQFFFSFPFFFLPQADIRKSQLACGQGTSQNEPHLNESIRCNQSE